MSFNDLYNAICNATNITPEKIILLFINFILGSIGTSINFVYEIYKIYGLKIKLAPFVKSNFGFLFVFCCIGGIISTIIVPLKAYKSAIFTGFGLMSILEQISTGKKSVALLEGYSAEITNKALAESDKKLNKKLEELKKKGIRDD